MTETLRTSHMWSNDEPPPSYMEVVFLEHWPEQPPSWQNFSNEVLLDLTPPPSYSSLDLPSLIPEWPPPKIPTAESSLQSKDPTPVTEKQPTRSGGDVPSYIAWSIITTIIFPPLGVIALILSLKVFIAQGNNDASLAWKYHIMAWRINLVATALGTFALLYIVFSVPLMFVSPSTNVSSASSQGRI